MSKISDAQEHLDTAASRGRNLAEQMESMASEIRSTIDEIQEIGGRDESRMIEALEQAAQACLQAQEALGAMSATAVDYMDSI